MSEKNARNSAFELLRICAMFQIVGFHLVRYSGMRFEPAALTVPRLWTAFLWMGGKLGVDVFVLISGWFLVTARMRPTLVRYGLNRYFD